MSPLNAPHPQLPVAIDSLLVSNPLLIDEKPAKHFVISRKMLLIMNCSDSEWKCNASIATK